MTNAVPDDADAAIDFVVDEANLRATHEQWVASIGRGWRIDRLMTRVFFALGAASALAALALGASFLALAAFFVGVASFETWRRERRRAAWLRFARGLPAYGRALRFVARDGLLEQVLPAPDEPRLRVTTDLYRTPRGYILRCELPKAVHVPAGVASPLHASLYFPVDAIRPPMSRERFERLFTHDPD